MCAMPRIPLKSQEREPVEVRSQEEARTRLWTRVEVGLGTFNAITPLTIDRTGSCRGDGWYMVFVLAWPYFQYSSLQPVLQT